RPHGPLGQRLGSLAIFTRDDFEGAWRRVARGGFGLRSRCSESAVKAPCLQPDAASCHVELLIEEAAEMEKIKFLHIMSIYGCGEPLDMVMEFMASGSLEKMVPTHSLSRQPKFHITPETSLTLRFLHSIKPPLFYRDLKPGNLLPDSNINFIHTPLISDFGLSKWMEQSIQMQYTEGSALWGTISYSPPEMSLEGNKAVGPKYDVCSFGILIWESLTQKKPYSGFPCPLLLPSSAHGDRCHLSPQPVSDEWPGGAQKTINLLSHSRDPAVPGCMSDITVETDILLPLFQGPMADPESKAVQDGALPAVSPSLGRQVSVEVSQELTDRDTGSRFQKCTCLQGSGSASPPGLCFLEGLTPVLAFGTVTPLTSRWCGAQVRLLLAHEVHMDGPSTCGYTLLLIATQDQQPNLCALLLQHGADAKLAEEDSWVPLPFIAQSSGDSSALPPDHGGPCGCPGARGWTLPHLATQNTSENVARLLASRQADPNLREAEGRTPLHVAAYFGHASLVKLPRGQGAELAQQRNLRMPLPLAVERGEVRAIRHLLKSGAAPDALDRSTAATRGKCLAWEVLLRDGTGFELLGRQGWTPLHLAAYKGPLGGCPPTGREAGERGSSQRHEGDTLHLAAHHGEELVAWALLWCDADPSAAKWGAGHLSTWPSRGVVSLSILSLLEHHADTPARSKVGMPAHLKALKGTWPSPKAALAGAWLGIRDRASCAPPQLALRSQKQSTITLLVGKEPSSLALLGDGEPGAQAES
uniref:Ankyrin repeat and kinase domain containing 1 n=1 Tax=Mustela putorius furo TaxID=9669 RepID=M3XXM1_MUSPF